MKKDLIASYSRICQKIGAGLSAPSSSQIQSALFLIGLCLIVGGLTQFSEAQGTYQGVGKYNDDRIAESVDILLAYVNGTFGALIMVSAGIGAILSSAFGQYRAALGLLVVAVGSFILRSLVSTWFNDGSLKAQSDGTL